jgi:molybdate/tungstate transport system substrate-binding protein
VRRLVLVFLLVGVAGVLFVGSFRPGGGGAGCSGDVMGFVAPTLMRVVSDAVAEAGLSGGGLLSIGSVEGLRRMQQGVLPDIYGSVDVELLQDVVGLGSRRVFVLGRFGMGLVCRSPVVSPEDLGERVVALADSNKAPIGYRALALAWMLKRDALLISCLGLRSWG